MWTRLTCQWGSHTHCAYTGARTIFNCNNFSRAECYNLPSKPNVVSEFIGSYWFKTRLFAAFITFPETFSVDCWKDMRQVLVQIR